MKPFILFAGDNMYPRGGYNDCVGAFLSLDEALKAARGGYEWWHIYDARTNSVVHWSYEDENEIVD